MHPPHQSIPDHLDLLDSNEANGLSQLYRQKSLEWEPLNRPLNIPRPSGETAMKFSALQPEVFLSPTHSDEFYRPNFNVRNGQRDSDRSLRLINTADAYKRGAYPPDSSSDFQYIVSDFRTGNAMTFSLISHPVSTYVWATHILALLNFVRLGNAQQFVEKNFPGVLCN